METSDEPRTLDANQRRVLGALIEKAKTTPDAYPLSLNALRTACNQKSNRFPQTDFSEDQVDQIADDLRTKGALSRVQGDSRVERYRHLAYDWFGVDKVELAVLAELLLRGAQTVGDLRGRAARMEPIKGVAELTPVLRSLCEKGLVAYLTPQGRGAVVTHNYYSEGELARVRRDLGISADAAPAGDPNPQPSSAESTGEVESNQPVATDQVAALREEMRIAIEELRSEIQQIKQRIG